GFGFSPRACCGQWRGCCMLRDDHKSWSIPSLFFLHPPFIGVGYHGSRGFVPILSTAAV
uniref:Uncharacterized protein n=1 Tax=Aegilops tauschii subsp. strangulata TaxID=200361 RepID=A0A453CUW8_AEGTS